MDKLLIALAFASPFIFFTVRFYLLFGELVSVRKENVYLWAATRATDTPTKYDALGLAREEQRSRDEA